MPRKFWSLKEKPTAVPKVVSSAASSPALDLSSGTGTMVQGPLEISQQSPEPQKSLWDQAYEDLRRDKNHLVGAYEQILIAEAEIEIISLDDVNLSKREKQMSALVTKKLEIMNKKQWRFNIGDKSVEIREQIDRIVKVVLVTKDLVSAVASMDSVHAGLPWAGICTLPLLVNDSKQRTDALDGLEEISKLVRRYTEVERIYCQGNETTLQKDLDSAIAKLYGQILEYEARAIC